MSDDHRTSDDRAADREMSDREREIAELVTVHRAGDARLARLTVAGELDSYTVPALLDPLTTAVADRPFVVVLDLTAVTFFGSAALRCLLDSQLRATVAGVRLAVVGSPIVVRVLELTGTVPLLDVHATLRSAVASVDGCDPKSTRHRTS